MIRRPFRSIARAIALIATLTQPIAAAAHLSSAKSTPTPPAQAGASRPAGTTIAPYRPAACQALIFNASVVDGHAVKSPWGAAEFAALFQAALDAKLSAKPRAAELSQVDVFQAAQDVLTGCLGIPITVGPTDDSVYHTNPAMKR